MAIKSNGPFTSLSTFLNKGDETNVDIKLGTLFENHHSDESSNDDDDPICKEVLVYCEREAGKLCAHINDLQGRPVREVLAITTEQLSAVMKFALQIFTIYMKMYCEILYKAYCACLIGYFIKQCVMKMRSFLHQIEIHHFSNLGCVKKPINGASHIPRIIN